MTSNRQRVLGDINPAVTTGLEIGALHNPIVKKSDGNILYVDYAPAEILRERFLYPHASADDIVETDIVWNEKPLADSVDGTVDYILASHVIEHVPDLIGWLNELRTVLKEDGLLGLIVPDRRYTFDARRTVSSPGEMVEAYILRYKRPSIRQIFDAAVLSQHSPQKWEMDGTRDGLPAEILERMLSAFNWMKSLHESGQYQDCHCWVFTPESFLDMCEYMHALELFPYRVEYISPTQPGSFEFVVRLRATSSSSESIASSIKKARVVLKTAYDAQFATGPEEDDATKLRQEIAMLRNSTSWKITAPLRAIASLMHLRSPP